MLLAVSRDLVLQLTASGVITAAFYAVMALGFGLIMATTGRFHFAYGFGYTLGGYLTYTATEKLDLPWWLAMAAAIALIAAFGVLVEAVVYRPLERKAGAQSLLAIFISALGLGIAGENLVKLIWGPSDLVLSSVSQKFYAWGPVTFVNFDVGQVITALIVVPGIALLLRYTDLGRRITAVKANTELAEAMGVGTRQVVLSVFAIGSALSVLAGTWRYAKFSVTAGMGFAPTLTAFVVVFLAGLQLRPLLIAAWSLAIALAERYVTIWFDAQWSRLVVLAGLLLYLLVRSARLSGWSPSRILGSKRAVV